MKVVTYLGYYGNKVNLCGDWYLKTKVDKHTCIFIHKTRGSGIIHCFANKSWRSELLRMWRK